MSDYVNKAPQYALKNHQAIKQSAICGCYHCLAVFQSTEITQWTDQSQTGLCPKCSVDAVLPESAGIPLNETSLSVIQRYWFGR